MGAFEDETARPGRREAPTARTRTTPTARTKIQQFKQLHLQARVAPAGLPSCSSMGAWIIVKFRMTLAVATVHGAP